jgi:flagellar hook-associated protein 1
MSLNQLIGISRSSFVALDAAMNATAQNVANMETEGYTRRRVSLQSVNTLPQGLYSPPMGRVGTGAGVSVQEYERLRDTLLQKSAWEARGGLGGYDTQHRLMMAVEGIMGPTGEGSLSSLLGDFYSGWSRLADNPNDQGARLALRGSAETLAGTLNRLDSDIQRLTERATGELRNTVDDANELLREIADLNDIITGARNRGTPDLSAEDRRDAAVDRLASLLPISVQTDRADGFTITAEGMALVQGTKTVPLRVSSTDGGPLTVHFGDSPYTLRASGGPGGVIGSTLHHANNALPEIRQALDLLAADVVSATNSVHSSGYGSNGSTGINFFHYEAGPPPQGVSAATIRVSDHVRADAGYIAASSLDPSQGFLDGDIAQAIAEHRANDGLIDGRQAPEAFVISLMSGIGAAVKSASAEATSRGHVVDHLTAMENGVSGVSIEEEMTNMIRFQQAYAASARVLNTAQEMMDTILRM